MLLGSLYITFWSLEFSGLVFLILYSEVCLGLKNSQLVSIPQSKCEAGLWAVFTAVSGVSWVDGGVVVVVVVVVAVVVVVVEVVVVVVGVVVVVVGACGHLRCPVGNLQPWNSF